MTLSEKLYSLRHGANMSQEELSERLECSRQVISKWENGVTTPDAEMLGRYSKLFGVSVDYLLRDELEEPAAVYRKEEKGGLQLPQILGLVISLIGCLALVILGAITVFDSKLSEQLAMSSVIVIDGRFMAMLLAVLLVALGAVILIKSIKRK
ncbi:MAG: helix-turn-helix transcriptional regulator [Clostridia bacterium]|nr:helix-turn-helix transcriptional regulator [Clostridia bacterium]